MRSCRRDPAPDRANCQHHLDERARYRARSGTYYDHDAHVVKTYGLPPGRYAQMMLEQDGVCAVCGNACVTGRRLAVDHDHNTGAVRGLLCIRCNRAVGYLRDDPETALRLADYLAGFQGV